MIKKQIIGILLSVIVVGFLGIGILYYSGYDLEDFIGESANEEIESFLVENGFIDGISQETKEEVKDLSKAFSIILEKGTRPFFQGYPVDQSFLLWLNKTYGNEVVMDLAYQIYEGYSQKNLWYEETGSSIHVLWMKYCEDLQFSSHDLENVYWLETNEDGEITIDFTGDINLADDWYTMEALATKPNGIYDCISQEIVTELQGADISVINHEFVLTDGGDRQMDKAYTFGGKTENVALLEAFGADVANLANNHAYDFRESGLKDTIATLEENKIISMGAGANLTEAKAVKYLIVNGRKIAFVSATEIERYTNYTKEATETEAGVLKTKNLAILEEAIRGASKKSDFVIANLHWGNEGSLSYTGSQYNMANKLVNAGADAIIGGHPHRLQGIEYIGDVPVVFSLGNFWFSTGTLYTTIAQLRIDDKGEMALRMIPCIQKDLTTSMLSEEESVDFYKFLADVSRSIVIDNQGYIYNTAQGQNGDLVGDTYYRSGMRYDSHTGLRDLEDRPIDIVGNLQ